MPSRLASSSLATAAAEEEEEEAMPLPTPSSSKCQTQRRMGGTEEERAMRDDAHASHGHGHCHGHGHGHGANVDNADDADTDAVRDESRSASDSSLPGPFCRAGSTCVSCFYPSSTPAPSQSPCGNVGGDDCGREDAIEVYGGGRSDSSVKVGFGGGIGDLPPFRPGSQPPPPPPPLLPPPHSTPCGNYTGGLLGRTRLDSLASYESAREAPARDDQVVMTPGEADDLAELRSLLPLFRAMAIERGGLIARVDPGRSSPPTVCKARSRSRTASSSNGRGGYGGADGPPGSPFSVISKASKCSESTARTSRGSVHRRRRPRGGRDARDSDFIEHVSPGLKSGALHGVFTTRLSSRLESEDDDSIDGGDDGGGNNEIKAAMAAPEVVDKDAVEAKDASKDADSPIFFDHYDSDSSSSFSVDGVGVSSPTSAGTRTRAYVKLSRDVYSLLYFTLPYSVGFFFAIAIFVFQMLILTLIMVDIVDPTSRGNTLNIPSGVSTVVRISQALAILVAVATQDDLITSVNAMHVGYDGKLELRKGVGGRYWQWLLSVAGRFLEGSLCLAVTFILIMQSSDVVGLFLDFLAVTFVSTLDNIAFALAQDGYFSKRLYRETVEVMRVRVPKPTKASHLFRPFAFFVVSAAMLSGWGVISARQKRGTYLSCSRIAVQFGDEFRATLAFFSSIYEVDRFDLEGRPVYVERGQEGEVGGLYGHAMFAYCEEENAWTFSFSDSITGDIDPCNWYAKSVETESWDIMVIGPGEWFVYGRESKSAVPFQHFSILCVDCDNSNHGSCSEVGTCVNDRCVCNEGRYGLNCEFEEPCGELAVDASRGAFPGPAEWSETFKILYQQDNVTKAKAYERPVYTNEYTNGTHHVILYTGRRWILANSMVLTDSKQPLSSWQLAEYLTHRFHAHWSSYHAEFISSPADVVTPTDAATPVGLDWFRSKTYNKGADENYPVNSLLLCTQCDDRANPCRNGGICGNDGRCACNYGTFGDLCQVNSFVLCRSIWLQFGDELISFLPSFSGRYDLIERTIAGRSVYVARRLKGGMFAYCKEEMAWTLTLLPPGSKVSARDADPCSDWKVISTPTETYDITTLTTGWSVRRTGDAKEGVPLAYFMLTCADCGRNKKRDPCNGAGQCISNTCVCDEGKYGLMCAMNEPCPVVELDSSTEFKWPARFEVFRQDDGRDIQVYFRPVYISNMTDSTFFLIIFTGRRWTISRFDKHFDSNANTRAALARYLTDEFHGYYSNFTVEMISEPIEINTNMDVASPVDLNWYLPKLFDNKRVDLQEPLNTSPRCAYCNNLDHPCYNRGVCTDGVCACPRGTFGTLCHVDSVCSSISLEFGASLPAPLPSLSGVYSLAGGGSDTISDRPFYVSETGFAMVAYCEADVAWTFSYQGAGGSENLSNPCDGWVARSGPSYTYDVTETSKWHIQRNETTRLALSVALFSYACNDERRRAREHDVRA